MSNATRMRVYTLARDLDVDSGQVMTVCRGLGIDVKNKLSSLSQAQCEGIKRVIGRNGPDGPDGDAGVPAKLPRTPPQDNSRVSLREPT